MVYYKTMPAVNQYIIYILPLFSYFISHQWFRYVHRFYYFLEACVVRAALLKFKLCFFTLADNRWYRVLCFYQFFFRILTSYIFTCYQWFRNFQCLYPVLKKSVLRAALLKFKLHFFTFVDGWINNLQGFFQFVFCKFVRGCSPPVLICSGL
mgnify:CR=1 FL=1